MRKSEITLMSQKAESIKKAQTDYIKSFINLVLQRAPNRSFYFPMGMIYDEINRAEWSLACLTWDDKLDVMKATICKRKGNRLDTDTMSYAALPLRMLTMIDTAIMDKEIMEKQSLYQSEWEKELAETEYYLTESKMRHSLVKHIEEKILHSGVLKVDKKLTLHNGGVIDLNRKPTMYSIGDSVMPLNGFEVSTLKNLLSAVENAICKLRN